ncbi:N-formylglutamate amidohydrolase [Stieleria neptunia]|uniref:N-formylglutamate amidohydrolase n=2 Tax=Stieleria neptunia TaxID=2527979 RepID=A0A518HPN1_9BACT|nr:N-formylglutamate amidohydrolase [Stieleria neptunia]
MDLISFANSDRAYVVTCEHGGNQVPHDFADAFGRGDAKAWLASHRGHDPGSLAAARQLAESLRVDRISSTTTRLLVDLNRSLDHESLFSKFTRDLADDRKRLILDRYYHPYRNAVGNAIDAIVDRGQTAIHFSVHTFTPRIAGVWRPIDLGLLFDPDAAGEAEYCRQWRQRLLERSPKRRILMNEPYAGTADGLTTALRKRYDSRRYFGIEIEINNRFFKRSPEHQRRVVDELLAAGRERPVD